MNKVNKESLNITQDRLKKLKKLLPEVFIEGKIDFDKLKLVLGEDITTGDEYYSFNWAGKKDAIKNIQTPSYGTLTPSEEESINFTSSENLFIEGDNLEVLKLLQKSYSNKVKMIYIDPPYNTGKDFVYNDNYKDNIKNYLQKTGQINDEGNKLTTNSESNGRYHSDWLTMMYSRLFLSRNLLKEDGVIFLSIDDNEVYNLKRIMDEIYGEENHLGTVIWKTTTDNNPSQIAVEHEYILCYAKNKNNQDKWYAPSENGKMIQNKYERLKEIHNEDYNIIEKELRKWIKSNENKLSGVTQYNRVDNKGVYYPHDASNPHPGGYRYEVLHPITKKPCKQPRNGFRWPLDTFQEMVDSGDIEFGDDETTIPKPKRRLEQAKDVLRSVYYEDNRKSTKDLRNMFDGNDVFDNPKSVNLLKNIFKFVVKDDKNSVILDFFAGSGTTAQAVLEMNKEDDGNRQFICVQLPELTSKDSSAYKAGYKNIAEISKERIRRVINGYGDNEPLDEGFRVFKLAKSNYKVWEELESDNVTVEDLEKQLMLFQDSLVDGYKDIDVIYELIIKEGYSLNSEIEELNLESNRVYKVKDKKNHFYITLDETVNEVVLEELNFDEETLFICLDTSLKDDSKINLSNRLNLKTI